MNISPPKKNSQQPAGVKVSDFLAFSMKKNHWLVRIPSSLYYFVGQMAQYFPDHSPKKGGLNIKIAQETHSFSNQFHQLHQLSAGRVWRVQCATSMWRVGWKLRLLNLRRDFFMDILWWLNEHTHTSIYIYISSWWLNQPIWKIWSSNWIIFPYSDEHKKCLKPPPRYKN